MLFEAANQSYVPQLVPRELLNAGYARVEQAGAVAGSTGPLIAGVLIRIVGAPLAVLVDAFTYLMSGLLLASLKAPDPVGFFIVSQAIGIESPVEMSYRQAVTPDRLRGRMNATIRSMNWGMVAVGAPLGGVLADQVGYRFALWIGLSGAVVQALAPAVSPTRRARTDDELDPSTADLTRHGAEAAAGEGKG